MSVKTETKKISTFTLKNWSLLVLCAVIAISITWAGLEVARATALTATRVKLIQDKADIIASHFGETDFEETVVRLSSEGGMQVIIFTYFEDRIDFGRIVINASPFNPSQSNEEIYIDNFYRDMVNTCVLNMINTGNESSCDIYQTNFSDASFIVYYKLLELNGRNYFMYASVPLSTVEDSVGILYAQLLMSTIIAFVTVVLVSVLLAFKITGPVKQLSDNSTRMVKGDYSVFFDGNGSQEIDKLAENLNYAVTQLRQTQTLRQDVIANVSHDLKTPLTLIKSYAELLKDFPDAPEKKREDRINLIISETDRMTRLVNEMLRLAKEESGVIPINKTVFSLSELVEDTAAVFSVKESQGYNFDVSVQPDLYVSADRSQIEKVIQNYIQNAVSYTGRDLKVKIELKEISGKARFDVIDTGKGIPENEQEKIWDRYYRASKQYTRGSGTGLGLSIVKNILVRHDVNFGVNSVKGKGSDFFFEIPVAPPPDSDAE